MAELGVITSVIQIADTGLRLSIKLYTFGELVASADKSVLSLSKDVSLTSSVLKELGEVLQSDGKKDSKFLTKTAIKTANDVVQECLSVFTDMETILVKKMPHLRTPGEEKMSKATMLMERLKWPYLQPKLNYLQSNLDRLKSTILLMLNVITYARQVSAKDQSEIVLADQRSLIEGLAQSNQDYIKKFENLKLGIESDLSNPAPGESCVDDNFKSASQPTINLANIRNVNESTSSALNVLEDILETHAPSANDPRLTNVQHYFELLTTMLKEVDEMKYQIQVTSRSRVRVAIHDTFDQEMHFLAHPFGDNLSKRVRDHFACLVTASRDKWNPYASNMTFTDDSSYPYQALAPSTGLPRQSHNALKRMSSLGQRPRLKDETVSEQTTGKGQQLWTGAQPMPPIMFPAKNANKSGKNKKTATLKIWIEILSDFEGPITDKLGELLKFVAVDADSNEILKRCNDIENLKDTIRTRIHLKLDTIESHDAGLIAQKQQMLQATEQYLALLDRKLQSLLSMQSSKHGQPERSNKGSNVGEQLVSPINEYEQQLQRLEQQILARKTHTQQMHQKPAAAQVAQAGLPRATLRQSQYHSQRLESFSLEAEEAPSAAAPGRQVRGDHSQGFAESFGQQPSKLSPYHSAPGKHRCPYPGCGRYFTDLPAHVRTHVLNRPEKQAQETLKQQFPSVAARSDLQVDAVSEKDDSAAKTPQRVLRRRPVPRTSVKRPSPSVESPSKPELEREKEPPDVLDKKGPLPISIGSRRSMLAPRPLEILPPQAKKRKYPKGPDMEDETMNVPRIEENVWEVKSSGYNGARAYPLMVDEMSIRPIAEQTIWELPKSELAAPETSQKKNAADEYMALWILPDH